jgi:hypothetical protein
MPTPRQMRTLFPGAQLFVERWLGLPKSLIVVSRRGFREQPHGLLVISDGCSAGPGGPVLEPALQAATRSDVGRLGASTDRPGCGTTRAG